MKMRFLPTLLGSGSSAGVLAFLATHGEGYASEIAQYIEMDLYAAQKQLEKFESAGLLNSVADGRTRVYRFNPGYPLLAELKSLIGRSLTLEAKAQPRGGSARLPESLRAYFWDYAFDGLSWESDRELIVRRLLTNGSWEAITWLRKRIGDGALRKWLIAHQGRGLSPRQLRFWSLVLGLPARRANAWTLAARTNPWNQR